MTIHVAGCRWGPLLGAILLILTTGGSAGAQQSLQDLLTIDADGQLQFARHLFEQQDYDNAANEYRRFVYFFPADPRVDRVRHQIGRCQYRNGQYPAAVKTFEAIVEQRPPSDYAALSYLSMAECYLKLNAASQAIHTLDRLMASSGQPAIRAKAAYRKGWIYLQNHQWEKARASFSQVPATAGDPERLHALDQALASVDEIPRKNPTTAGMLAVIPGAGHLYCNRYQDALMAFVINAGLILAAVEAFDHDQPALGGLLSLVGLGFYSGNIYSAVNNAHKYNRRQQNRFVEQLEDQFGVDLAAGVRPNGFEVALRWHF